MKFIRSYNLYFDIPVPGKRIRTKCLDNSGKSSCICTFENSEMNAFTPQVLSRILYESFLYELAKCVFVPSLSLSIYAIKAC